MSGGAVGGEEGVATAAAAGIEGGAGGEVDGLGPAGDDRLAGGVDGDAGPLLGALATEVGGVDQGALGIEFGHEGVAVAA